ncbi:FkbM family methyltransferase [Solirubrobacter sp. CPCC 204708]|uniref:FkbM family methyltransferase n=1 Tax=Solirubrobacter deserti TaxID=2282478 RepID=A0ABT4REZ8_9ACTN|nr:FkbM family methyltransferase [Solirubrobacter deserti]MBE2318647.1 FkbM family methyltransferase [Solirubrobacter deserti]MDA0137105.1 FkbM family methyltransferase [Solirubrobacter deserti]
MKALVQRGLKRLGYTLYRDVPRDTANPLPVEQAAHAALLRAVIERAHVNCVLDVGAHRGGFHHLLRANGYRGEIVSFEPVSTSFAALGVDGDPAWRAHRLALGREAGVATINVARESNFTSFLEPNRFSVEHFGGSEVDRQEEVEVQRLDALFADVTAHVPAARVLLKTDTQGWDLEVIEGAAGCLQHVVALQVELSVRAIYDGAPGWLETLDRLRALGFRPAQLTSVGRDAGLGLLELDCLLVREGAG